MLENLGEDGFCTGCGEYDGCICARLRFEEEQERRYMEGLDDEPEDDDDEEESES